jgi:hypothetical protein
LHLATLTALPEALLPSTRRISRGAAQSSLKLLLSALLLGGDIETRLLKKPCADLLLLNSVGWPITGEFEMI